MPIYDYVDKNSGKAVPIIRHHRDYEIVPTREEASNLGDEEYQVAIWEREIGTTSVLKSRSWMRHGAKGYW